jgi:hypothetical protein
MCHGLVLLAISRFACLQQHTHCQVIWSQKSSQTAAAAQGLGCWQQHQQHVCEQQQQQQQWQQDQQPVAGAPTAATG